jgi:hypothetical protein
VRLDTTTHDEVARMLVERTGDGGGVHDEEVVARPFERASPVVVDAHDGTLLLKVEVALRVDDRDAF